ncbi:NADPH-dependent FMN reductase [Propylenella binzhouense]|uniref:NADPH-dependent oxidoreductase n=1 Tax=Propylenella binzhouense TaxID=2555902 RepID=A0A964T374_9HYPH|nr:NAD(P)H-dependent oxidoreductase [Propylenella binzhouense]MYZ47608.1 NADPH-dependent oxidoreductase [Propylenella binzhouense]
MDVLVIPGSLRSGSYNVRLASLAVKELALSGATVTRLSLADYPLPIYDGDLEAEKGVPEPARRLARHFLAHDAILIVSPEYNAGVSALVKNTIDWVSRVGMEPFRAAVFGLAAASPGGFGGLRGLISLRQSLELELGALVVPEQMLVPRAGAAFDADGAFVDPKMADRLRSMLRALLARAAAQKRI